MAITTNVPSDQFDDWRRDGQDLTRVVNSDSSVTTRTGKVLKSLPQFSAEAEAALQSTGWFNVGTFAAGFEFTAYNQVGRDADGEFWSYNGALPFTVPPATVPSEPDYTNRGDAALRSALAEVDSELPFGGLTVGELVYDAYVTSSVFQRFVNKLVGNQQDLNIQVLSDSTGNETFEWPYKILIEIANQYPEYTVIYKLWDNANNTYFADETIQTGTGVHTITMANGAFPGAESAHFLGFRKEPVRAGIASFDLLMLNFGHNGGTAQTELDVRNRHLTSYAQYVQNYAPADVVCIIQNINTSFQAYSAAMAAGIARVAGELGIGTVDVYKLWSDKLRSTGTVSDWMLDQVHPNSLGHDQIVRLIMSAMKHSGSKERLTPKNIMALRNQSYAPNSWFSLWSGTNPDNWGVSNVTVNRDFDSFETGLYGVNVEATADGGSFLTTLTEQMSFLDGGMFFACRHFTPVDSVSLNGGRLSITTSVGSISSPIYPDNKGAWQWSIAYISPEMMNSPSITLRVLAGNAGDNVIIDRVIFGAGELPTDVALDGAIPQLDQYFNSNNVGTTASNVAVVTGDDVAVTSSETFASFFVNLFGLVVGVSYTATWLAPSNTGNLLIRAGVNDTGDFTTVALTAQSATFTAVAYGQSLSFRAFTGQTTLNINDISIVPA